MTLYFHNSELTGEDKPEGAHPDDNSLSPRSKRKSQELRREQRRLLANIEEDEKDRHNRSNNGPISPNTPAQKQKKKRDRGPGFS